MSVILEFEQWRAPSGAARGLDFVSHGMCDAQYMLRCSMNFKGAMVRGRGKQPAGTRIFF